MRTGNPWGNIDETLRRLYTACSRCKIVYICVTVNKKYKYMSSMCYDVEVTRNYFCSIC